MQVSEEHPLQTRVERKKFISDSDNLILEDTLQRISLCGDIDPNHFYTGTVIALAGKEEKPGQFYVDDVAFVGLPEVAPIKEINLDRCVLWA